MTSGSTVTLSGSGNYSGGTSLSGGAVLPKVNADRPWGGQQHDYLRGQQHATRGHDTEHEPQRDD